MAGAEILETKEKDAKPRGGQRSYKEGEGRAKGPSERSDVRLAAAPDFLHHVTPRGLRSIRFEAYNTIMNVRKAFLKARVDSGNVYKGSKKQLEVRPRRRPS